MDFISRVTPPPPPRGPAYWFVFQGDRMLALGGPSSGGAEVPLAEDASRLGLAPIRQLYLGYLEEAGGRQIDCWAAEIAADDPLPAGMSPEGLRQLYPLLGDEMWGLAGRAVQVVAWDRTHRFCGQCATPTEPLSHERARRCPNCGLVNYPRLSPAIIIAVVRDTGRSRELLLGRNHRFPTGRYSVLAGYVEPGESLEECARREVAEEVGITIRNVRYFGSQPWPFPNSLMIGFTAEYEGGEIHPEEAELADARWFATDTLPDLPPRFTIARQLINWFIDGAGLS